MYIICLLTFFFREISKCYWLVFFHNSLNFILTTTIFLIDSDQVPFISYSTLAGISSGAGRASAALLFLECLIQLASRWSLNKEMHLEDYKSEGVNAKYYSITVYLTTATAVHKLSLKVCG